VGGLAGGGALPASATPQPDIVSWIDRHAVPLRRTDALGPVDDLWPVRRIVRDARIVGLGESAHGTHTELTLKHRVMRYLVERMGFRTIAWEESWGSGVAIDRYVVTGVGDPRAIVGDAMFMLRREALLDLVRWMRTFNRHRPAHDKVRFLGADVLELRPVQYDELRHHVAEVAPGRLAELERHLDPIKLRGSVWWEHLSWYLARDFTDELKRPYIEHARAAYELVRSLRGRGKTVERDDAVQHAHAILGFYESYTKAGDKNDVRDRYVSEILLAWRRRTGHRVIYSAANAHTTSSPRMLVSFPDPYPGDDTAERELAGGRLRRRLGRGYVSIGTVFDHGGVFTGWEADGGPKVYDVPPPHASFIDHTLGRTRRPDYLLDLHAPAPPAVRVWLDGPAKLRIMSSAYYPDNDANYSQAVDSLTEGFDALLHVGEVAPARML
jgi:erythromycin esterase